VKDSSGVAITTGTTSLRIFEIQSDGSLKQYDFNDNTFKTTALTTATASMTHQTTNTTQSTGTGTLKMAGATSRNNTGFLRVTIGGTVSYIPYFTTITG
jgi:2-keto-3-deoxy-galactonokinase